MGGPLSRSKTALGSVALGIAFTGLSIGGVGPRFVTRRLNVEAQPAAGSTTSAGEATPGAVGSAAQTRRLATGPAQRAGLACALGRNGGATDKGVTGSTVSLAATIVQSGIGRSFLGQVHLGMQAVVDRVNRQGGICGRLLKLRLVDDGWDPNQGANFLRNFIAENVFALAVVPSSEGLQVVSKSGDLRRAGIPVVGADGMLIHQYTDPLIWPVAASTMTAMHIIAKNGYERGARSFGIVYDANYHFGIEGAYAFNQAVRRLTGKSIEGYSNPLTDPRCRGSFCGIQAGQPAYTDSVETFNSACSRYPGGACDLTVLLLEPDTALAWLRSGARSSRLPMAGSQPLFNDKFAQECGIACKDMWLWTGYNPPLAPYNGLPALQRYVSELRQKSASVDVYNSFVQGGYLGMELLVQAMRTVGPDLTRSRFRAALDATDLDTGLAPRLSWRPGRHFANGHMQAYSIRYQQGFAGWGRETDYIADPWLGRDIP
jgi:ABC-type branched-subunit amino acid transport system substrate-binding protein